MGRFGTCLLVLALVACSGEGVVDTVSGDTEPGSSSSTGTAESSTPTVVDAGNTLTCWTAPPADGDSIGFSDQTEAAGLVDPLLGMYAHAAVWGDFDGDDHNDLFVGTFADRDPPDYQVRGATGRAPDRLLSSDGASFSLDTRLPDMFSRTSGGAVADFDNDGDLDLVVSRSFDDDMTEAPWTQVLRNDDGALVPVTDSGLPTTGFGGRSVGVLDYDLDGDPDLFIANDEGGSVLLRNEGGMRFTDVTVEAGLPTDVFGLGVAVADLNGDRRADLFVAGSNRLFVSDGATFREADSTVFQWQLFGDEDLVTGASIADVNRDGLLDLVVGHHFNSTVDDGARVPVRLYLNRGSEGGTPSFEEVTAAAGIPDLPTKAPHVELNDIDNDGWPDIVTTASSADGTRPAVLRHEGLEGDVPRFATPDGLGSAQYWVAGPTNDYDRDGRLDLFLVEFEPTLPSLLLRNESTSGHWLEVSVGAEHGFGIGWRVDVFTAGTDDLLGAREITVTQGYSAGVAPVAHFGLGEATSVDVRLTPPGDAETALLSAVAADQHLRFPSGCGEG